MNDVEWFSRGKLWWPADSSTRDYDYIIMHLADIDVTVKYCKQRRTVVQAGSHVGLWPMRLAKYFNQVLTFEVNPLFHEACRLNCEKYPNIQCIAEGLGPVEGNYPLWVHPTSIGGSSIRQDGKKIVRLTTIDSFCLNDLDAIILDVEKFELQVLIGALTTIKNCKPLLHIEEPHKQDKTYASEKAIILEFMDGIGYRQIDTAGHDVIYISKD